jgi:hypothetical protein
MTLDELAGLLHASRYLPRGEAVGVDALRAVPELADGLPALVFDARGPHVWSGCSDALRAPLAGLGAALASEARLPPADDDRRLHEDPLVVTLTRLVIEGARHSPGAAGVPSLEVMRGAQLAQAEPALAALHAGTAGGEPLRRVAAGVQARLSAACARAADVVRVPALAWAVARASLLPLYARGSLDRDPSWARVADVLGVPLPPGTIEAIEAAVGLAVRGVAERRAAGKSTADDGVLLLRALGSMRLDAGVDAAAAGLLLDPDGLAVLLPALSRYVDAKALQAQKVDAARAASLLTPSGGLAAASVLLEVIAALRTWDVLSQLVDVVGAPPQRMFVVPRATPARGVVVAVGLGRLRTDPIRSEAVDATWSELTRGAEGNPVAEVGSSGLAVFADAVDALRFVILLRRRLDGAPVGVAAGAVTGGTDGACVRLQGPAVEAALRWVAAAPSGARSGGDDAALRLRHVGGWLCGDGVGFDSAAAEAVQDVRVRRGLATAADGPPGGDPRALRGLDVHRVFEFDGAVVAFVRIPGIAGGFEAMHVGAAEWRELLDRDGDRNEPSVSSTPLPIDRVAPEIVLPVPVEASALEEGHGWEMAESDDAEEAPVTLDLEEHIFEAPAPPRTQPRFEFDEPGDGVPGADDSLFSGFYLPGAPSRTDEPPPRTTVQASVFDMEVEEDDEATQDWGANVDAGGPSAPSAAPSGDPFAGDPFAASGAAHEAAGDPFSAHPAAPLASFDDVFAAPAASPSPSGPATSGPSGLHLLDFDDEAEPTLAFDESGRDAATVDYGGRRAQHHAVASLDFEFLLKGYACFFDKKEAVFGRPYGTRIVDRHVYPYRGDSEEVYMAFLKDKLTEGFVPRADMMGDLPRGVTVMPLDAEAMQRAWKELS